MCLLKIKMRAKRFNGFAHRIFQLGAVIGCAVKPPRKTIRIPTIAEKRNIIKVMMLSSHVLWVFHNKIMIISELMLNMKMGVKYQGEINSLGGAS